MRQATPTAELPSAFRAHGSCFAAVLGADPRLELVAETDAHEGPVYAADEHALYFTTVRRERVAIERLDLATGDVTVVRADANTANGMTLDREGRLVVCEQGTLEGPARITRFDRRTRTWETLADAYDRRPLNSPNDVVVSRDGAVWFSDPSYGHLQGFRPEPQVPDAVYRLDPATASLAVAATGFDKPNGLAFSPDESVLYVADNGAPHHLLAFDVAPDASLHGRRVLAVGTPEHPDGLKVDAEGRIYASASTGLHVLAPDGALIGEIVLPGAVNFTFGSWNGGSSALFVTADTAIWAAVLHAKGA